MVVRLRLSSDLHLERCNSAIEFAKLVTPTACSANGEVLALIGDIGSPVDNNLLADFLSWCSKHFRYVLYVAGNHDIKWRRGGQPETCEQMVGRLRGLCGRHPNVRLLDNETWVLEDVMFIGSTLWVSRAPGCSPHEASGHRPDTA